MVSTAEKYGWAVVFALLIAFAVPWFLWGNSRTALGLPVWLWWHIGWMVLASATFWTFATRAWGVGITDHATTEGGRA
jgi:hypothetical protein